jgi:hypothetical protein
LRFVLRSAMPHTSQALCGGSRDSSIDRRFRSTGRERKSGSRRNGRLAAWFTSSTPSRPGSRRMMPTRQRSRSGTAPTRWPGPTLLGPPDDRTCGCSGNDCQLVRRVSSCAEASVSPTVLLERVCEAVEALAFDRIALVAEALDAQNLVFASDRRASSVVSTANAIWRFARLLDRRYWARTSDPELVETHPRSRPFAPVTPFRGFGLHPSYVSSVGRRLLWAGGSTW